jgi:hypothetical protein
MQCCEKEKMMAKKNFYWCKDESAKAMLFAGDKAETFEMTPGIVIHDSEHQLYHYKNGESDKNKAYLHILFVLNSLRSRSYSKSFDYHHVIS